MTYAMHSKGPWKRGKYPGDVETENGRSIALVFSDHVTREVFKIQGPVVANKAEAEANVRLITAAPELLQALALLTLQVKRDLGMFPDQPHKDSALGIAEAAIRKATHD